MIDCAHRCCTNHHAGLSIWAAGAVQVDRTRASLRKAFGSRLTDRRLPRTPAASGPEEFGCFDGAAPAKFNFSHQILVPLALADLGSPRFSEALSGSATRVC